MLTAGSLPDSHNRTWYVLEREDGTICVYYTAPSLPGQMVVWDEMSTARDAELIDQLQAPFLRQLRAQRAELLAALRELVTDIDTHQGGVLPYGCGSAARALLRFYSQQVTP